MSDKQKRTPHHDRTELGSAAVGRDPAREQRDGAASAIAAEVELAMSDLVGDDNGEIVFFNDSDLRRLAIATDAALVADGRASSHRTAAGEDVSGFRYLSFDNGLTLYYQAGLDVVVRRSGAG